MPMPGRSREERLTSSAKCVPAGERPHAREELGQAAREDGHADDDVWRSHPTRLDIDEREDQGRGCEREQTAGIQFRSISTFTLGEGE